MRNTAFRRPLLFSVFTAPMPVCGAKSRSRSGRLLRRKADTAADFTVLLDKHLHCGRAKTAHRAWDSQHWRLYVMILAQERCTPPFVALQEASAISATRTCHSLGGHRNLGFPQTRSHLWHPASGGFRAVAGINAPPLSSSHL